ncbi:MAG: type II toxin-antitoxin system VapC family toxin [Candidatus Latescibacteria bacterium]|nr:type II toxin-antitoxin system VapC family toxin [Candidatus Latescibacterota bacterium]
MSVYYLDASALVKRYADESGSDWVRQITAPSSGHALLLAEVTLAEVAAALAAKARMPQGLSIEQRDQVLSRFLQDCDEVFLLLALDRSVVDQAVELTQRHHLRGYDSIQLATCLVARQPLEEELLPLPIFVASDHDLLAAARTEGLVTCDPVNPEETETPGMLPQ